MARCLVTGSNGLLGSQLVRKLEAQDHTVLRGDREGSILEDVDYIFDCAAYGNLYGQDSQTKTYQANIVRFNKLLRNARKMNYKALIATSSSSVTLPVQTHYSKTKKLMELSAMTEFYRHNKPIAAVRPYTIYGVGDNDIHLIPRIFRSCLFGEPMVFDPAPTHDYIWAEDLADAYIYMADNIQIYEGIIHPAGSGVSVTNAEVMIRIEQITGKIANITEYKNLRDYDNLNWVAPDGKWSKTSLQEGLEKIYADYQQRT